MARTTIATIFRESRGVVLLLMAVALLAASVMTLTSLQRVDAKEAAASASATDPVSVMEVGALTDTPSPAGQLQHDPGLGLPYLPRSANDWTWWTELVASGWDGERQWFYYCRFMRLCGRVSTLSCWTETE